ncbi:hypothetical protein CY34DRAFT_98916 [Suillus luteus UH-Slu-Lm8-n1]|uniref:CCHC-type domain-containing protein n=1 Tax=Suillus luteus UH-Slu-Lm8-n1 TaxID=930992 RepID=A0A0C9ZWS0_9AGAM|nr:hypothetical protein CY34DRAFT_98916 [Suillus luteus UH-Slu-Lm8-n1]
MGYPLNPGTAAIALSECFNCGTHGHNSRNCVLPADHTERLSRKEAAWRAIVSKALRPFNRATATPISLITNHMSGYASVSMDRGNTGPKGGKRQWVGVERGTTLT